MKATIAGHRYNTDKAVLIGRRHIGLENGWLAWQAALYASPHGSHWFLAGTGGRMTIFGGRERIIPLTLAEAGEFATRYLGRGSPAVEALFERVYRARNATEEART